MTLVQGPLNLLLDLRREVLVAIKHIEVFVITFPNKIINIADDLGRDTTPKNKIRGGNQLGQLKDSPMSPEERLEFAIVDPRAESQIALGDFDLVVLAFFVGAACTASRGEFYLG